MSEAAESPGIGLYAETGLHSALKAVYAARSEEARVEARVGGKVVDVVLPGELVEVQTKHLYSIVDKVLSLACLMPVRVVYPVLAGTLIERIDPDSGELASSRRSGTRRDFYSVFDELVRAPLIVASPNVRMDVVEVRVVERRVRDGSGSWRRKGDRTVSRELSEIVSTTSLDSRGDWLALLPAGRDEPWDSPSLGAALGLDAARARKILYTYAKAGLLSEAGKAGKRKLYVPT